MRMQTDALPLLIKQRQSWHGSYGMIAKPASRQLDPNRLTAPVSPSGRITARPLGSTTSIPHPPWLFSMLPYELPVLVLTNPTARSASAVSVSRKSLGPVPSRPAPPPLLRIPPFWLVATSSSAKSWPGVSLGSAAFWTHLAEKVSVPALNNVRVSPNASLALNDCTLLAAKNADGAEPPSRSALLAWAAFVAVSALPACVAFAAASALPACAADGT